MTYPGHRKEVRMEDSFLFRKDGPAVRTTSSIRSRPTLDYEAEVGILMKRGAPGRYGYVMVNDLTDRGIQVRTYDKVGPGPGFSLAKSFDGSLRVGPLLAVGNAEAWETLEAVLEVNGEPRQHLHARECVLRPGFLHGELCEDGGAAAWVFVSMGTPEGTAFHSPTLWEKIGLFIRSGFSVDEAEDDWLARLTFLQPGDIVKLYSSTLGSSTAVVIEAGEDES
jgi:2-keto-4-pentenoate hydratase/2-oxohepta-3-ene-1,7-dioic acid hydratase in catechol pathway